MKINNQSGEIITAIAIVAMCILGLVFVPNDLSKAAGIQNKQNKIVQTQAVKEELLPVTGDKGQPLFNADGSVAMKIRTTTKTADSDLQQQITLWERIKALPLVLLVLVICGATGVPGFLWVGKLYKDIKAAFKARTADTKRIVKGVDAALATIPLTLAGANLPGEIDRAALAEKLKANILKELSASYDQSTKDLVRGLRVA